MLFEDPPAVPPPPVATTRPPLFDRHPSPAVAVLLQFLASVSLGGGATLSIWAATYPYPDLQQGYGWLFGIGGIVFGIALLAVAPPRRRQTAYGRFATAALGRCPAIRAPVRRHKQLTTQSPHAWASQPSSS